MNDFRLKKKTAGWFAQLNANANFIHYIELPTGLQTSQESPNGEVTPVKSGVYNTLTPELLATETIFSPGLLYAANSAHLIVEQAKQANDSSKINIIATISSAFYNLLNTLEQVNVLKEDTAEFHKNMLDA